MAGPGRATSGRPTLQTSSNHHDLNHLARTSVTNVVNLSPKTNIFNEKAIGLTTFVTTRTRAPQNPSTTSQTTLGVRRTWLRCPWAAAGPGRASSRRVELPNSDPVPLVWRAPEGPEGTGGLRGAAPNEVRTPSLAGGRGLRRPEHPWGAQSRPARRVRPSGASNTSDRANRPYSPPPGSGRPV